MSLSFVGCAIAAALTFGAGNATNDDGLHLSIEPVKNHNILYEPVIVRVTLENTGDKTVPISASWTTKPEHSPIGVLVLAAPMVNEQKSLGEAQPPGERAYRSVVSTIQMSLTNVGPPVAFAPRQRRLHFQHILWSRYSRLYSPMVQRYTMSAPGVLWVKARFYYLYPEFSGSSKNPKYVESEPVPIRFRPVPEDEKRAAEMWNDPSLGSYLQFGVDATETRQPHAESAQTLRDFIRRFPRSTYTPYAKVMFEAQTRPATWAEEFFLRDHETPLALRLILPKRHYLAGEPLIVAAEITNVSDKPVEIDRRLRLADGLLDYLYVPEKKRTLAPEIGPGGSPGRVEQFGEPTSPKPDLTNLLPGQSARQVQYLFNMDRRSHPWVWLWARYEGGPEQIRAKLVQLEVVGSFFNPVGEGIEEARRMGIADLPSHEVEPHALWISSVNVSRYLKTGEDHQVHVDHRPAREVFQELVQKYPTSLYAFYARAALAHPKDWAERLMNDPNTQWPEVRSTRNLARPWLFLGSGFVLLLFTAVLWARHHRRQAAASASVLAENSSVPSQP